MKTFTKHILLLALMLFGVAGAAWADRAPQKFTGPVDIDDLVVGDTLAPGFSFTGFGSSQALDFEGNRHKQNGVLWDNTSGFNGNRLSGYGVDNPVAMIAFDGNSTFTPVDESGQDGNAWVVTITDDNYVRIGGITIDLTPDPTVPALDETTGNWNFLMPGSNKVVKAVLLDSIVVGPHVTVVDLAFEGKYANGTDTVYYYDTNSHSSLTLTAAANDGQGRNFGYWADLDPTDSSYSCYYRYIDSSSLTCGDTFRAVYLDNHTLTLNVPQGGTLELAGVTEETVYTIYFDHDGTDEGDKSITVPASRMPYDTIFSYNDKITFADAYDQQGESVSMVAKGAHTIIVRISGAFDYGGFYSCELEGGATDEWSISCMAGTGPVPTYGITKTGDNTYSVMEGLTVNVTATPDSAHYLSAIGNEAVISNSAYNISFTMPDDDAELAATFTTKPTLTLAQTEGGTLEAIIPSGAPTTAQLNVPSEWMTDNTYVSASHLPGLVAMTDEEAQAIACPDAEGYVRVIHKLEGVGYLRVIQFSNGVKQGQSSTIARDLDNLYNECNGSNLKYYYTTGTTAANVIASSTPNTYYIDYGTPVTVVATPDSVHYLVSFSDDDNDTNSNIAVEKTYDSVVNNINLSANFQAKPVLTLTANDGGTLTLDGMTTRDSALYDITIINQPQNITAYPYQKVFNFNGDVTEVSGGDDNVSIAITGQKQVTVTVNRGFSGHVNLGGAELDGADLLTINIPVSGTPAGSIQLVELPAGVVSANATLDTFVVNYDSTLTVVATPAEHYHLQGWSNNVTDNGDSTATLTLTQDETVSATFAQNAPELAWEYDDETLANGDTISAYHGFEMDSITKLTYSSNDEFFDAYMNALQNTGTSLLRFGSSNTNVVSFADAFDPQSLSVNAPGTATVYMVHDGSVMAYDSAYFTAVILAPDTLTLVHNDGGALEAIVPQGGEEETLLTTVTATGETSYSQSPDGIVTVTLNNIPAYSSDYGWYFGGIVTVEAAQGYTITRCVFKQYPNSFPNRVLADDLAPFTATMGYDGENYYVSAATSTGEVNGDDFMNGISTIEVYGYASADSIRAIVADTTYAVVPGANVTVKAMPDSAHYLVNWDNDAAIYSNTDTTKHYVVNGNVTSTATFNDKPVLTLAQDRALVSDDPDAWGNVTLGGDDLPAGVTQLTNTTYRVDYGTTLTVQADATELHHVANWVNADSVDYPAADITYSAYFVTEPVALFPDSSTLTLTVTADATAKALFGINSYDVVATAQLDDRAEIGTDTSMGYIAVSYIDIVGDAQTVDPADSVTITAQGGSASVFTVTPHYGYLFTGWSVTQNNQTTQSTQNPLTLTEAATVVARFVPDTFEVSTFTATPADTLASAGTVTGADRYAYRTMVTLEETPATGYHFVNWSNTARTALGTETTVTVQLMQDTAIFAVMDTNVYDITYTIQTDDRDEIGTNEPMGSVVLEGRHMHFLNDVLTVTPAYGYLFEGWYSNNELASTDNPFTFSPVADIEYEARFVPDTFTVSLTMNDEHAGDVLPHGQLPAGVTVGPNVTYRVPYLVPMTFYGAAMEHNHIVNWINENDAEYVDGVTYSDYLVCDTFPTTSLLTLAVTGDTTVKINFLVDYYYVTVGLDEESTGRGTVTGSGYYDHGDTVTAMASPAEGYHFDGWDNGVEISPYAFAAVQDSTILVHFDTNVYSLTVVAETDTNTGLPMGTTLGDGLVKHFLYYDIEAVAEEGYHFVMWTDSVTDNPRTVTLTENTTFTAHFEMDPIVDVVINGVSADETMGTVSGSDTVDYGEEVILTATANEHYHFVQWNDGNSDNPRTVVAAHDSTLTAYFAVNQYAVVGVSADETMGTVSGSDTADYQSVVVLTATAGDCYHFESWSDGETANPRSIVAEADTTVSALFAANVYSMNDTVTVCDSYEWNGTVYTQSGTYTHDGTTAAGCDMLETLYLTVNASTTAVETVTACDSYEWHDSVYTASTDESTYQTTNAAGCDSTVTLHLTVNAATASEESETACNYYTWHGETYTVSGDYSYTTQNAAGCDSTVTLHLTVNYGNLISIDSTVCDSIVWRGNVYTESGVYDFDLPSESGCFSIETLNLTVNYSSSAVETIFACDSYTWNGLQFDADNHTATYFTVNAVGCDSTVTLDLTVHYSNEGTDNVTACDSVEWHGTVYTASDNTATYSTINAAGCDSTVVLVLTINHSVSDTVEVTAEESYEWNGEVYSQSGTYTYSGTTEAGCDSTVTLLLTITYQPQPVYYTVTLVSADTTMGSVLPAEAMSVEEGSQFSATAIALYGRHFVAWERDGQVVSTDNPYSFEVTEDVELTATFAYNPVTVILSVNNANWGSTDPAPGTYTYEVGEQATVTATPAEGFHMMGWTINGTVIETDETTYTVEATPEMAGMTFSVVAMFVRDIAIDDVEDGNIAVYASEGKIVVSGAEHRDVYVYDVTGRCVSRQADAAETVVFPVAQTGVYMVKIGNLPARKVALVR